MDARLFFQWNGETAEKFVKFMREQEFLDASMDDIVGRVDADYEIGCSVKLTHKRKPRKKKDADLDPHSGQGNL